MCPELKSVSDDTIYNAGVSINKLLNELNETYGKGNHKNEIYMQVLRLSLQLTNEYFCRVGAKYRDTSVHDTNYDYKDRIKEN